MNRRDLLLACGFALLAATGAGAPSAQAPAAPSPQARLLEALQGNRLPLTMSRDGPAGRGWDWLVQQAREARFTLVGQEHGVAETAQLSAALFQALRGSGYSRMAIELSPVMTQDIEAAARRNGVQGIVEFLKTPGISTFYDLREEAQFVADVIKAGPKNEQVLWGFDREIFNDRYFISKLEAKVPPRARESFARLKEASARAWAHYGQDPNPDNLFILAGDPAVVSAVRADWRDPDRESDAILRTLEESLAIEAAERAGGAWPYFLRRAKWNRDNFAALLNEEPKRKAPSKIMMRFGYGRMIRGANYFNVFDLGAMADEVAALSGDQAFHVLVLPGPGSQQTVPGANGFVAVSSDEVDEMRAGDARLTRVLSNANAAGHEVIDLRALRPLAMRGLEGWNPDVIRTIHGYDAAVIWKGARAESPLK